MKENEKNSVNGKFYCIESYPPGISEDIELFTWKDACEVLKNYQIQYPEEELEIRKFEPI